MLNDFMYEQVKMFVVYTAFGWMIGLYILSVCYWIATFVKWVLKKFRKNHANEAIGEEEENHE